MHFQTQTSSIEWNCLSLRTMSQPWTISCIKSFTPPIWKIKTLLLLTLFLFSNKSKEKLWKSGILLYWWNPSCKIYPMWRDSLARGLFFWTCTMIWWRQTCCWEMATSITMSCRIITWYLACYLDPLCKLCFTLPHGRSKKNLVPQQLLWEVEEKCTFSFRFRKSINRL